MSPAREVNVLTSHGPPLRPSTAGLGSRRRGRRSQVLHLGLCAFGLLVGLGLCCIRPTRCASRFAPARVSRRERTPRRKRGTSNRERTPFGNVAHGVAALSFFAHPAVSRLRNGSWLPRRCGV